MKETYYSFRKDIFKLNKLPLKESLDSSIKILIIGAIVVKISKDD